MVAVFRIGRKIRGLLFGMSGLLALAACDVPVVGTGPDLSTKEVVPVALLLPRSSGEQGPGLAASFENAARLAMADLADVEIDLRVYDTAGIPSQTVNVTRAAIDDGAKVILGPLFSDAAAAAGQVAANRGVNVLSFSNNPAVAGGNVFLLGSTFQNTADRLVGYAASSGKPDIMIIHGESAAEEAGREAISRAIASNGARLAGTVSFPLNQRGLISSIPSIASVVNGSAADAIFMTSGNDGAIPFLAELLPENGVSPETTQFIGLQRLDIPSGAVQLNGLQGAWFAQPDPGLTQLYRSRYLNAYGSEPHPLSGLAYDGIAAIGALAASGSSLGQADLTRASGFAGVNGVFRFRPNGTNERGLAVAQILNKQVVILDPAPRSFGGFGF